MFAEDVFGVLWNGLPLFPPSLPWKRSWNARRLNDDAARVRTFAVLVSLWCLLWVMKGRLVGEASLFKPTVIQHPAKSPAHNSTRPSAFMRARATYARDDLYTKQHKQTESKAHSTRFIAKWFCLTSNISHRNLKNLTPDWSTVTSTLHWFQAISH